MVLASRYAVIEAILLRQFLRLRSLSQLAAINIQHSLTEFGDPESSSLRDLEHDELGDDLWRESALKLSHLSDDEMLLGARLVDVLVRWSEGQLE